MTSTNKIILTTFLLIFIIAHTLIAPIMQSMIIENSKFKVEYHYEDLKNNEFSSYERHVIWRYKYLNIGPEQVSKEEKEILKRYMLGAKTLDRKETYETGIYIRDIENIVDYTTEDTSQNIEYEEKQEQPDTTTGNNRTA